MPVFNERAVVERLIDAAAGLDYPAQLLQVQVLDDSTDETIERARARVEHWRRQGRDIELRHRADRAGFKAGALAAGLESASGEIIVIFDADFVPRPDFLLKTNLVHEHSHRHKQLVHRHPHVHEHAHEHEHKH